MNGLPTPEPASTAAPAAPVTVPQPTAVPAVIPGPLTPGTGSVSGSSATEPLPSPSPRRGIAAISTRLLLGPRLRSATAMDVVQFVAACPACGSDCDWLQEREDTRLRTTVTCSCPR